MRSNFEVEINHRRTERILTEIQTCININAGVSHVYFKLDLPERIFLNYLTDCYCIRFKTTTFKCPNYHLTSICPEDCEDAFKRQLRSHDYDYHRSAFMQYYEDNKHLYIRKEKRTMYLKGFLLLLVTVLFCAFLKWC